MLRRSVGLDLAIVVAVFPVIFLGRVAGQDHVRLIGPGDTRPSVGGLGRGRLRPFWCMWSLRRTVGVALFGCSRRGWWTQSRLAVMFAGSAVWAFRETGAEESDLVNREMASHGRVVTTAFLVIFVAEWGDLTQILTANLAAHYHSALSVGLGAVLALWLVAAIAVTGGARLLQHLSVKAGVGDWRGSGRPGHLLRLGGNHWVSPSIDPSDTVGAPDPRERADFRARRDGNAGGQDAVTGYGPAFAEEADRWTPSETSTATSPFERTDAKRRKGYP